MIGVLNSFVIQTNSVNVVDNLLKLFTKQECFSFEFNSW